MPGNPTADDLSRYEWQPCSLAFPRIGLLLNRDGVRTRLLWPGEYLVRVSRTLRQRIYRRRHGPEYGD
jgi:hypothetical protein